MLHRHHLPVAAPPSRSPLLPGPPLGYPSNFLITRAWTVLTSQHHAPHAAPPHHQRPLGCHQPRRLPRPPVITLRTFRVTGICKPDRTGGASSTGARRCRNARLAPPTERRHGATVAIRRPGFVARLTLPLRRRHCLSAYPADACAVRRGISDACVVWIAQHSFRRY
jgi:hypothetical protein